MSIKGVITIVFSIAIILSMIGLAAAITPAEVSQNVKNALDYIISAVEPIFKYILGDVKSTYEGSTGSIFFMKVIAFLLVATIVYAVSDTSGMFGTNKAVNMWLGILVSLIGIRFLPDNFLVSMSIPSSAFVAAIVLLIPFLVVTWVGTKISHPIARKVLYIVYGVLIIILWIYNYDNENLRGWGLWVYPVAAAAILTLFAFDGTLQRMWKKGKDSAKVSYTSDVARDQIEGEIRNLEAGLSAQKDPKEIDRISKEIDVKRKAINALYK